MYTPRQNLHSSNNYSAVKYFVWNTNVGAHSSILNSHSLFKRPSINNQNSFSHKKGSFSIVYRCLPRLDVQQKESFISSQMPNRYFP